MNANSVPKGSEAQKKLTPEEEFDKLCEDYRKDNWAYAAQEKRVELPGLGIVTLKKTISGTTYILKNNGSWERLRDEWFETMNKKIKEGQGVNEADKLVQPDTEQIVTNR
jgi:hypothetical protein